MTRATKFIAMLRPLHFNTNIHTCTLNIFLLGEICCRAGWKESFLKMGTIPVKARAYPREIKTIRISKVLPYRRSNVSVEIPSFPFLFARKFSQAFQAGAFILPLCRPTACCTCAVRTVKKFRVSGCRREAGDVCHLRCLINQSQPRDFFRQRP